MWRSRPTPCVPRTPRIQLPGGIYHVGTRGVRQQPIFVDDRDRQRFVALLGEVVRATGWRCLTYCLMGNHYHLVVQLREPNLSIGMQRLNGRYAAMFSARHRRPGHVFERRFWYSMVSRDEHLFALVQYVALNPVRAELCATAGDWRWSAHRALAGEEPAGFVDVAGALSFIDADQRRARTQYAALVEGAAALLRGQTP